MLDYSSTKMKKASFPEFLLFSGSKTSHLVTERWFDDGCILDMDYFVKTLAGIKAKGVRPDLIGSIIAHYASKWLPDLSDDHNPSTDKGLANLAKSPESVTTSWMKKRFFVETLVGILPPEKDSIPCNFLLRLLRIANMVGVEPTYRAELEKMISWQLDQASLKELMIPSFSHTCATLLDVELIIRLLGRFVNLDEVAKSGAALIKVAKLVDSYLAEAAVDSNLNLSEFVALAGALPSHSRATDDGLYRAIDTYLKVSSQWCRRFFIRTIQRRGGVVAEQEQLDMKGGVSAHPGVSKQERKVLFRLIDSRKLSQEASLHAAQNERLPVRAVIQVIFSEQTKLNRQMDWSGSFSGTRSPYIGLEAPARCLSKREMSVQQTEVRKLREDVHRLQSQCYALQAQMERSWEKKKGFFRWKKLGSVMPSMKSNNFSGVGKIEESNEGEGGVGCGIQTPVDLKTRLVRGKNKTPLVWRKSAS
ncbi:hypothetical protein POTOM_013367 [Populus tomentosa]|uniref:NPH3 domain-containing protein n=1 Tax=Populus tomentosa TaxID=118781 RepID=A0A8X8AG72_POPTO|nr:hypothetical protein POTOM_013367 [Populus tomentosa]